MSLPSQSVARKSATGLDIKPFGSGKSAFRFMIPHETIRSNPETQGFTEHEGNMTLWYGNDRRIVMYPCNDNTAMNFVCIHPSNLSDTALHGKFPRKRGRHPLQVLTNRRNEIRLESGEQQESSVGRFS